MAVSLEKVKHMLFATTFRKVLSGAIFAALTILYVATFFTKGIYYDDTFLKKNKTATETHYVGSNAYGKLHIIVSGEGSREVAFKLPNGIQRNYKVNLSKNSNPGKEISSIVDHKGKTIQIGYYDKDSYFLMDKNLEPLIQHDGIQALINGESPYNKNYIIGLKSVADLATFEGETIRGKAEWLILGMFTLGIIAIDIKYPTLFFQLSFFLHVKNPEPTDLYRNIQRLSWYVLPLVALVILLMAIF